MLRKLWFELTYRFGKPRWDTGQTPPEVLAFLATHAAGKALDIGCGTGTNVITLAQHGWQVVGVDYIGKAVQTARRKAQRAGLSADQARFFVGDASRLQDMPVLKLGPFDYILDIGCFHNLTAASRQGYLSGVDALLAPGGTFMMFGFLNIDPASFHGLREAEIAEMGRRWRLAERVDSPDTGTGRKSTWLTFEK